MRTLTRYTGDFSFAARISGPVKSKILLTVQKDDKNSFVHRTRVIDSLTNVFFFYSII